MTDRQIAALGPAFATYLRRFRRCFRQSRTAAHFDTYCRGLLSDLPRKSVEPIALAAGAAVRTLQEFLATAKWDHDQARATLQRHLGEVLAAVPADRLGTVGVIDETSARKWGDHTPGVQRQYLGCVGKLDHGIVTVHVGVARGTFQALLDADLDLPKEWDADRDRCRAAGIPDGVRYRPKWRIALEQLVRLETADVRFDWLVFDEGYGAAVPLLRVLNLAGRKFVAEVPVNFVVRGAAGDRSEWAAARLTAAHARAGHRFQITRQTAAVWAAGRGHTLLVAINEATAEVKYFLTNATEEPVARVLAVAFRRATVEHAFRLGKQEAGLMHYEGRDYTGLLRHLILALVVLGFVAVHTERLRGEKLGRDGGAGVPGAEPAVRGRAPATAGRPRGAAHR